MCVRARVLSTPSLEQTDVKNLLKKYFWQKIWNITNSTPHSPGPVEPHGAAYIATALPGSVKPSERSALFPVTVVGPVQHSKTLDTAVYRLRLHTVSRCGLSSQQQSMLQIEPCSGLVSCDTVQFGRLVPSSRCSVENSYVTGRMEKSA